MNTSEFLFSKLDAPIETGQSQLALNSSRHFFFVYFDFPSLFVVYVLLFIFGSMHRKFN